MQANTRTGAYNNGNSDLARKVFYVALFFFLLLQAYGIYFYQLRMQSDAADDVIRYSAGNSILPPQPVFFRYAYLLNKLLLKPATLLHLPIQQVAGLYCFNDLLFYISVALFIILFTRRYDYAAVVMAAATLLPFSNFYYIFNELYLSGAVMLLYLAVYSHMQRGPLRSALLIGSVFFMVWTHPAMLIVMAAFIPGLYTSFRQVKRDKWLLGFIALSVIVRIILFSGYDHSHIQRINGTYNPQLAVTNFVEWLKLYWYLPILSIYGFIKARGTGNTSAYRGFIILPVILYLLGQNNVHLLDANFAKYVYPLNLLMLTLGLNALIRYATFSHARVLVYVLVCFLSTGVMFIDKLHGRLVIHAEVLKSLTAICNAEDAGHSKWYVRSKELVAIDPLYTGINSESILFSALAGHNTTIQVVSITDADTAAMAASKADEFYLNGLAPLPVSNLNPNYFNFKAGNYRELILDTTRLDIIRSAVSRNYRHKKSDTF